MKQLEVTILGQSYILGCPDGGESLLGVAVANVDREMSAIRDAGKVRARERIAVLAALNLAYQLADHHANPGAGTPAPAEATQVASFDLDTLIGRIDAVLGDDGQLL